MSKDNGTIYDNRFVWKVLNCIDKKYPQTHTLRKSICKRLLELALYPIKDVLKENEENWRYIDEHTTYTFDGVVSFPYEGTLVNFCLPYVHFDYIQQHIGGTRTFYEQYLLEEVRRKYIKPGMVYLDCGANIGNHTLFFSLVCEAKKIYCFEGNPDTFEMLKKNIEVNNLEERCKIHNCVLGEHAGHAEIDFFIKENIGGTSFKESDTGVEMKCLDEMNFSERIDFVKMDVEGFEYFVLKGMKELLRRDKPTLWVEVFEDRRDDVFSLMDEYGYKNVEALSGDNYIFVAK